MLKDSLPPSRTFLDSVNRWDDAAQSQALDMPLKMTYVLTDLGEQS